MRFDEAYKYLLSLGHETLAIKLGLANTERLLAALDHPHKSFPSVQIAGTNGKGSTAVMLESICREAGIRTGLFTSPHLISITERIRIDGREISEHEFALLTQHIKGIAAGLVARGELQALPTFFEHVTAIALLAFRESKVELAILETGLGGRLDATTAAGAEIVALTPIAMDHEEYLGSTIEQIAAEKAAIVRPKVTAIIAPQQDALSLVVKQRCLSVGVEPRLVDLELVKNKAIGLRGRHQMVNAATTVALVEALREKGFVISGEAVLRGLGNAKHPGRLEMWEGQPPILFDGAHNPAAARALRDYLDEFVHQPITMIFGAMRDKNIRELLSLLCPVAKIVILTGLDNPRAASIEQLRAVVPADFDRAKLYEAPSVSEALTLAREINDPTSLVLVTGSLYLVGAARQSLIAVGASAQ